MGFLISNGHCIHVIEFFGGLGKFPFTQNDATWFESSKNQKTWVSMPKVPIALCKLQGVNVKLLIANARGQGPIAKCKSQIWQVRLPSAKGKVQIARGQGPGISHKRGQHQSKTYPLQKNQGFDNKGFEFQSWSAMVLVQISIGQCQGAKGQRPIANYKLRLQIAKSQGQIARGQRQGISHKIHKNQVKPYKIQSKTKDFDSQGFGFQSWFAMVLW